MPVAPAMTTSRGRYFGRRLRWILNGRKPQAWWSAIKPR